MSQKKKKKKTAPSGNISVKENPAAKPSGKTPDSTPEKVSEKTPIKERPAKPAPVKEAAPRPVPPQPRTVAGQIVEYTPDPEEKKDDRDDFFKEDKLELATMTAKERRAVKKARREKEMEGMNRGQRFKYLLYYYQWPLIVTTMVAGCIIWLIVALATSKPPVAISAAFLNADSEKEITEDLLSTYMKEANINSTYRAVAEGFHLSMDTLMQDISDNMNNPDFTRFPALARDSYYDIVITDKGGLDYLSYNDLAKYPDYVLPQDMLEALKDREAKATDAYGQTFVYGYDISDTEFAKNLNLGYKKTYLCFPGSTSESQMHAEHFARYIFNLPTPEAQ
ncbi:MAG: hypothetical protein IKQ49_06120 [Eubacterium sp.]|nr:hypothetical protein [Eubacterium sp.]